LRLSTHPRVFDRPWSTTDACQQISSWLSARTAVIVSPGASVATFDRDFERFGVDVVQPTS